MVSILLCLQAMTSLSCHLATASLQIRPIMSKDFVSALQQIKSSVSMELLADMERWKQEYGANS